MGRGTNHRTQGIKHVLQNVAQSFFDTGFVFHLWLSKFSANRRAISAPPASELN